MNQSRHGFITLLALAALLTSPVSSLADTAATLLNFDPTVPETPESIVLDRDDNVYVSLALTGEVRKITPDLQQSTLAVLPIGAPCGQQPALAGGLALDRREENLYVAVVACDPSNNGVWRIGLGDESGDGGVTVELLANAPSHTALNGLAIHRGYVYAADTFGGMVWRVPTDGGNLEVWSDDPLLGIPEGSPLPGPNGVRAFRNRIYVAVSARGTVVEISFAGGDAAGEASVYATVPDGQGCDEFAFDRQGRIYCATNFFNTLLRLDPDGTSETLLTGADGLDGPTSVVFGRRPGNRRTLYIANASFPFFTESFTPSLMTLTFGPGQN